MDFHDLIRSFLRDSPAAHRRRCAIRLGVREPDTAACDHAQHWDLTHQWCNRCGITRKELIEERHVSRTPLT